MKSSLCLLLFMLNIEDFHVKKIFKLNIEKNFICSFICFVRSSYPMFRETSGSTFKQEEWTSMCTTCKCYIIKVWEFSLVQCPSAAKFATAATWPSVAKNIAKTFIFTLFWAARSSPDICHNVIGCSLGFDWLVVFYENKIRYLLNVKLFTIRS